MAKRGTMCYLVHNGKTLMLEKGVREGDPNSQSLTPPGGKIDPGEIPFSSCLKEMGQETGYVPKNMRYRGAVVFNNENRAFADWKNPKDFLVHVYSATEYDGESNGGTEEGIPVWVDNRDLASLMVQEGDKLILRWLTNGRFFTGFITYNGTEIDYERTHVEFFE